MYPHSPFKIPGGTLWVGLLLASVLANACATLDADHPGHLVPPTVTVDSTLPRIQVNGTILHAETMGSPDDPVIVFLHGGPGGGGYRSMLRLATLQDDYFLVFWDQRGAGLSQRHPPEVYTMETYLDDLLAVIDHFTPSDTSRVILVGHSWGGQYTTAFISAFPDRVARAVLIDPGPFNREMLDAIGFYDFNLTHRWFNDWLWNNDFLSPDSHARADFIRTLDGGPTGELNAGYHLSTTDPAQGWRLGAVAATAILRSAPNFDFTRGLHRFTTPVLFIRGALNEIHNATYIRQQMAYYPNARLVTIDDVGHDLHWVKADEVVAAIRTYLQPGRMP